MPDYAEKNFFEHDAKLPSWYWTGDTKMKCLQHAIGQSLEHAYAHHIQRLMVTGNFALLIGVHPDEVDQWYLGIYIDALQWVEITNTRGMSQYADGGLLATKPYVASANYMNKISDYCKNCHYNHRKKTEDDACPFNTLYWDFMDRHRDKLENNARIGMAYRTWDRYDDDQKEDILRKAAWAIASGDRVKIAGQLAKDMEMLYDPVQDPNIFTFYIRDDAGETQKVVLLQPKPQDFELSEQVVLTGRMQEDETLSGSWRKLGRISFGVHGLSVFLVIGLIFYVMVNNYYEYQYVQAHVNDDLQFRYIFSAFWEGQEGSFLLWMFWHVVLGGLLILSAKEWESPVLTIVNSAQVIIGSMILGVYIGFGPEAFRMGSNPMLLLRDTMDIPLFANADYVSLLEGTGLNPLLQNWWMTVHPPTLFLGFASTVVPFAFAMSGLWTREHRAWLKPALPWALFSGAILGTGILMGGAWAYEALSFGGYWAWDPVENMSLVPWLTLVAGIHTNLVAPGGSAISHIGFGLMLVGILFSGLNQEVISRNPFLMEGLTASEEAKRNSVLLIKDSPMIMGEYEVTLQNDTIDYLTRTYFVNFERKNQQGEVVESFELTPNILYNKEFSKVAAANPSTRQYWSRDIFTHIVALPPEEMDINEKKAKEDSLKYRPFVLEVGQQVNYLDTTPVLDRDTFSVQEMEVELLEVYRDATHPDYIAEQGDLAVGAKIRVRSAEVDSNFIAEPVIVLRGEVLYTFPDQINPINARVKLNEEIFNLVYTPETELDYQEFELTKGETFNFEGYELRFAGYNKDIALKSYEAQEGDIAVSAMFQARDAAGQVRAAQPVFLIRDSRPMNLKDEISDFGLHFRFVSLDPETEKARVFIAQHESPKPQAAFSVASRSFRTDWIALQAIQFPGINYFWIGASLMMFGLTISMYHRIQQKREVAS
eukprot:g92.t1